MERESLQQKENVKLFITTEMRKNGCRTEGGDACAAINESQMKEERDEERLKDQTRCT